MSEMKIMKTSFVYTIISLLLLVTVFTTCDKNPDDPGEENSAEVITTLRLRFTDSSNTSVTTTFSFEDPDGDGGNAPVVFDDITLDSNSAYDVTLELLDESDPGNVVDLTSEINAERTEHIFCYTVDGADVVVELSDSDGSFPVGLTSTWRTGASGSGTVRVVLKHQPDGLKDGTCSPGETDIDVTFDTVIQ